MSPQEGLEWLKAVSTPLAGTAYEPWVHMLQFVLVVAGSVSLIARLLPRRDVAAVAEQIWSLLKQVGRAFVHANRYPPAPALERRLDRLFLYGALVLYASLGALGALSTISIGFYFVRFLSANVWSCKPRQNFLSAGGELTRPCPIDINSTSHQGRTARRMRPLMYQSQGRQIRGVTPIWYGRLHSPLE